MPNATIPLAELTPKDKERFWAKVNKDGPIHPYDATHGQCWLWTAAQIGEGYGCFSMHSKSVKAHRVSYVLANGSEAMPYCLHSCDRRLCVNPAHLRPGTPKDNGEDMAKRGRCADRRGDLNFAHRHPELMPRGEAVGTAILTEARVRKIRSDYSCGYTLKQIAAEEGIHFTTVWLVVKRIRWAHVV